MTTLDDAINYIKQALDNDKKRQEALDQQIGNPSIFSIGYRSGLLDSRLSALDTLLKMTMKSEA